MLNGVIIMPKLTFPYVDYESQFLIALSPEHHSRHLGQAYSFSKTTTLSAGSSYYIEMRTPSNLHEVAFKVLEIVSDQTIKTEFFEAPTITIVGTQAVPLIQRNRRSTATAHTLLFDNPSGISGGTLLRTLYHGAGGNKPISGTVSDDTGWSLKASTTYIIKLTNVSSQTANIIGYHGFLFEVDRDA